MSMYKQERPQLEIFSTNLKRIMAEKGISQNAKEKADFVEKSAGTSGADERIRTLR